MKVTYTRKGDYLLPDLYLEKEENYGRLGRYGILRLHFIAQNKKALYETLLMTNKLTHHLLLESRSCENYYKELMENYIKNDERLSEKNKELNPLEWTWIYVKFLDTFFENFFIFMRPLSSLYYILNLYWYKWYTELLTSLFTPIQI